MRLRAFSPLLAIMLFCLLGKAEEQFAEQETADRIVVEKADRQLILYHGQDTLRTYSIALGREPVGKKQCYGDGRTPEGKYVIDSRNRNSRYHRSLHISYPNAADRKASQQLGCNPGGNIVIHGLPNGMEWIGESHRESDWTAGCIAVTNVEIEEIWALVPDGTLVEINP